MPRSTPLFLLLLLGLTLVAPAEAQKPKELQWSHAFDLAARKFGEQEFTKNTQKFGVETFRDSNNGLGLYLSQTGSLACAPGFQMLNVPVKDSKGPEWLTGLDLPARKAGQKEFNKQTKVHSLEIFRDPNSNDWLFITEKGELAVAPARTKPAGGSRAAKWVHSVDLSVRKGGVKEWKDAAKIGVEIYRDANTGNLIYVSETGAIAVLPDAVEIKGPGKAPEWLHGLDLACRKHDEPSFTKNTRKFGVEVYRDVTTNNLLFVSETGSLAVAAAPPNLKAPTAKVREPQWTHGLNMKCRTFGEKEFSDKTRVFGAEAFRDDNVNVLLYVNEIGAISAAAK